MLPLTLLGINVPAVVLLTYLLTHLFDTAVRIVSVRETRITGIMSHVFIGLSLLFIDQLQLIPRPVLDGLFLYLAVTALHCNQLFERIMLLVTEQVSARRGKAGSRGSTGLLPPPEIWCSGQQLHMTHMNNIIFVLCIHHLHLGS